MKQTMEDEGDECLSNDPNATEEEEEEEEDDDDPRQSAAALCLSLFFQNPQLKDDNKNNSITNDNHNDTMEDGSFGVEFTHQCFEGEFIPGYQPYPQDVEQRMRQIHRLSDNDEQAPQHDSHKHVETAQEYLRVRVHIAPSCRSCKVQFETEPNELAKEEEAANDKENNHAKRRKIDVTTSGNDNNKEFEEQKPAAVAAEASKMPLNQVLECLQKMLPDIDDDKSQNNNVKDEYLETPMGTVLYEYDINSNTTRDSPNCCCVTLANASETPGLADYHHSVQRLALGWIETADGIDVTYQPHAGQFWQVLYVFQKHSAHQYSLVGYMTLWNVFSPFFKPQGGRILRITQALILPHHQRRGHGQEMMKAVYRLAKGEFEAQLPKSSSSSSPQYNEYAHEALVVQVNVEDPAPSFTALRDLVDYQTFVKDPELQHCLLADKAATTPSYSMLKEPALNVVAARSKLTPKQCQIVHELFWLRSLQLQEHAVSGAASASDENDNDKEKPLRLAVKERLYQEHKGAIAALSGKDAMRAALANLYQEQRDHYDRILAKVHKQNE